MDEDHLKQEAKEVLGIEDSTEQREQQLQDKQNRGESTDRDRMELEELKQQREDES